VEWTGEMPEIRGRLPVLRVQGKIRFGSGCVLQSVQVPILIEVRAGATLQMGDRVQMNCGVRILTTERIEIENDVLLGAGATVYDSHLHQTEPGDRVNPRPVRIETGVWLGRNSIVLRGVTVGAFSIVGAGCVASRDVPPHAIVVSPVPVQVRECEPTAGWVRR
jgi:acetyltransferase-like isoleucine patch superfamily enzyme